MQRYNPKGKYFQPPLRSNDFYVGLNHLISQELSSFTVMAEIGCFMGESTIMFANKVNHVTAIDPWTLIDGMRLAEGVDSGYGKLIYFDMKKAEFEFDKNLSNHAKKNITKIKAYDQDVIDNFKDESFDFVYIDAIHTEEELSKQINRWLPKIRKGCKIGGHDYCPVFPGVRIAVNKIFKNIRLYKDNSWITEVKNIN